MAISDNRKEVLDAYFQDKAIAQWIEKHAHSASNVATLELTTLHIQNGALLCLVVANVFKLEEFSSQIQWNDGIEYNINFKICQNAIEIWADKRNMDDKIVQFQDLFTKVCN